MPSNTTTVEIYDQDLVVLKALQRDDEDLKDTIRWLLQADRDERVQRYESTAELLRAAREGELAEHAGAHDPEQQSLKDQNS